MIRFAGFGRARRDAKGRMTDLLDKAAHLACWRGPVELQPLKGGLTNISFVATCLRREIRRALRRATSRSITSSATASARPRGRPSRRVSRPKSSMSSPASWCCASSTAAPWARTILRARLGRLVPLLKRLPRQGRSSRARTGQHLLGLPRHSRLRHLARRRHALPGRGRPARAGRRCRCRSCSAITISCRATSSTTAGKIWLIDWEYGAFGTAMFDLANLSSNGEFGAPEDAALLDAYFEGRVATICAEPSRHEGGQRACARRCGRWCRTSICGRPASTTRRMPATTSPGSSG